jgi:hypothetical protein
VIGAGASPGPSAEAMFRRGYGRNRFVRREGSATGPLMYASFPLGKSGQVAYFNTLADARCRFAHTLVGRRGAL